MTMDPADFRTRLDAALADAPDAPTPASDVAAGKRLLARRRAACGGAMAALAVAVVVPGALVLAGVGEGDGGSSPAPPASSAPAPAPDGLMPGWRWESYRNATFQVPDSWGYASPISWCLSPEAAVRRPATHARAIGCGPEGAIGYGVQFHAEATYDGLSSPGQLVGVDSERSGWIGHQIVGDTVVEVFARSEEVARQVLDSVRPIEGEDMNGCAPTADLQGNIGNAPLLESIDHVKSGSVCRYDVAAGAKLEELLVQSELLTGDDADAALSSLQAAPVTTEQRATCPKVIDTEAVLVRLDGHDVWVNWGSDCREIGVLDGSQVRALTADVMHWALSPGWSGEFPVDHVADHDLFDPRSLGDSSTSYDNWEQVTWRNVRFDVPPKWDRAAATDWCVSAIRPEDAVPRVSLPSMAVRHILCHPERGYGVSLERGGATDLKTEAEVPWQYPEGGGAFPDDAWVVALRVGDWIVTIRTPDRELTERIAASVVTGTD